MLDFLTHCNVLTDFLIATVYQIYLGHFLPVQMRRARKLQVLITSLLLVLQVWGLKPTYRTLLAGVLLMWLDWISNLLFFKIKHGEPNIKVQVWSAKPNYKKSWAGLLLM